MPLRWGIAGFGWVAQDFAAPAIAASRNGALVAVHDLSATARQNAASAFPQASIHTDLQPFLQQIGAVYVATPNHAHREIVEQAARAGVAVLCEKPMAATLEDATAMVAACARANVTYATAFDQRFHPAHLHAAALIRNGALGRIFAIRIAYCCWVDGNFQNDNWRIDRARAGGGALIDLAPHGLDLASCLLGERLTDIASLAQNRVQDYAVEDGAMIIARSASGVLVQLHISYNCPETFPRRRLEILGTRAQIVASDTMGQTPGGTLTMTDAATGAITTIDVPDAGRSPFLNQMEAFADAVLTGSTFPHPPSQDLQIMALVAQAQHQAEASLRHAA